MNRNATPDILTEHAAINVYYVVSDEVDCETAILLLFIRQNIRTLSKSSLVVCDDDTKSQLLQPHT